MSQMSKVLGDKLEGTRQFADLVGIRLVSDAQEQHEAGEAQTCPSDRSVVTPEDE